MEMNIIGALMQDFHQQSTSCVASYSHLGISLDTLSCQIDLAVCKEGPELLKPIDASLLQILNKRRRTQS